MKVCSSCRLEKEYSCFGKNRRKKDGYQNECRECRKARDAERYKNFTEEDLERRRRSKRQRAERNVRFVVGYLGGRFCADCGCSDVRVLEFDHVSGKEFNIADRINSYSVERLLCEISRCEVRCANCHSRKTAREFQIMKLDPETWLDSPDHDIRRKARDMVRVVKYISENPCADCGCSDPLCLQFDHRKGEEKLFDVSSEIGRKNIKNIFYEISKCDVRCANCHRIKTAADGGWLRMRILQELAGAGAV